MKKKLFALLLAGCMVLSVTACGSEEKEEKAETTEDSAAANENETDTSAYGTSTLVSLGEYKGLTYTALDTTVTDEEVETQIQSMLSSSYNKVSTEIATETSVVNIDYEGKKDGVAFDGGTAQGTELDLGNSNFIEGFAESIVGMKVGETKDCPMTFPEDYHAEELKGQDVVFTITVNECWEKEPSQLDNTFAEQKGYDSVEALYAGVREELETARQQEADSEKEYQLLQKLVDSSTFDLNEDEIALYVDSIKNQYSSYASMFGYDLETYVTLASGMTMEEFEEQCREIAIYQIQCPLVENAVAEAEGLEVTDEIYAEKAEKYKNYYGYDSVEALESAYTKETVMMQVTADMALDFIVENATAVEE